MRTGRDKTELMPLYFDGEPVRGKVNFYSIIFGLSHVLYTQVQIRAKEGRKVEHNGIKVEFLGTIELYSDRGKHYDFLCLQQELAVPGELKHTVSYDFEFKNVEKQYESYHGINAKLR